LDSLNNRRCVLTRPKAHWAANAEAKRMSGKAARSAVGFSHKRPRTQPIAGWSSLYCGSLD
jgi:hypothetical protein